ncbi:MAG TPA: long-chain-fatty-acid--CoA ligase [bacterium]
MQANSNYTPLTPLSFLRRNARVYPDKTAITYEGRQTNFAQFYERTKRLCSALKKRGIGLDDKVGLLLPNVPAHLEADFGIPMTGGVIVALNYRLSSPELSFIINHCDAKILIVDWEYLPLIQPIVKELKNIKQFVTVIDPGVKPAWQPDGAVDYEAFLASGDPKDEGVYPEDENQTIAINYTSGTTGNPKGVMYTHRSAYLNATCDLLQMNMGPDSVYVWTLPMFHCNGWCYTWGVTAIGGNNVCLRKVAPKEVVTAIVEHKATHFCGAPIVLRMVADGAKEVGLQRFPHRVQVSVAAAPPSPAVIESMLALNVGVVHVYGLTETYGPTTVCEVQPSWRNLSSSDLAKMMARQGVPYLLSEDLQVLDEDNRPVPRDGKTLGEVCMKGNIVMKGYYKNPKATEEALRGGWFHSGDLGVMHPDGYIELRDRAKDIIISGGENISTIEVENTLYAHPAVMDCAVVSKPDDKWGEVPVAFITLKEGQKATEEELIAFVRDRLAHYKAPKAVMFQALPRTSTGKVQKFVLRDKLWAGRKNRIGG